MENNQEFTFFLEESLWFKEGQGVNELLGISLEPQVSISDLGEDVRLHGFVQLSGEYLAKDQKEMYRDDDVRQAGRMIQKVERSAEDEDVSEFFHMFPVEITVSKDRVADMEDVVINIESFDYELPESNQLRLHAELVMNGILQERSVNREEAEQEDIITLGPVVYKEEKEDEIRTVNAELEESSRKETHQTLADFFQTKEPEAEVEQEYVEEETEGEGAEGDDTQQEEQEESPPSVNGFKQIFQHLFPNRDETYTQMKMYIVQEDETIEMIAERYEVPVKQLEKVNQVEDDVTAGQVVYIPN
ncbi:LysM peptidoglycan-binding domain-containing protein [Halobacillus sp. Marseille-Q1614]|uniref:LysM peptidoglycan-binding domain-containing protein n=1 Tax=Halobacillus sp. Marseille-Q1614 TaxID=2709134 RepID=UPI00156FE154|nr:LysM peptidoglycan-binding domain-containing protein [Halobacillus sp. Marseille-Q1614]